MSDYLSPYLVPASDGDPCGPDLRWDPEVTGLDTVVAQVFSADDQGVVEGEVSVPAGVPVPRELAESTRSLLDRTKSIPVLAAHARALWMAEGLAGLALGLESLVAVVERWPDPATGVHPRADEDGDLGERYAALARSVHDLPRYASRIGWGKTTDDAAMRSTAERLRVLFAAWGTRLGPALAGDVPAAADLWRTLRGLEGMEGLLSEAGAPSGEEGGEHEAAGDGTASPPARTDDPWALLDATLLAMERNNRHSPAVLMLRLIATWKDKDVTYIVKSMGDAGLGLEALVKALQAQIDAASR